MRFLMFAVLAVAVLSARADRTLNREAAERMFAPIAVAEKVERLEAEAVTKDGLKPQTAYVAGELTSVTARPFATTTVRASEARGEDEAMTAAFISADSRNYDVFLPDDAKTRTLLPISIKVEVEGAESYVSTNRIETLPAFVHIREPTPGVVVIGVEPVR